MPIITCWGYLENYCIKSLRGVFDKGEKAQVQDCCAKMKRAFDFLDIILSDHYTQMIDKANFLKDVDFFTGSLFTKIDLSRRTSESTTLYPGEQDTEKAVDGAWLRLNDLVHQLILQKDDISLFIEGSGLESKAILKEIHGCCSFIDAVVYPDADTSNGAISFVQTSYYASFQGESHTTEEIEPTREPINSLDAANPPMMDYHELRTLLTDEVFAKKLNHLKQRYLNFLINTFLADLSYLAGQNSIYRRNLSVLEDTVNILQFTNYKNVHQYDSSKLLKIINEESLE